MKNVTHYLASSTLSFLALFNVAAHAETDPAFDTPKLDGEGSNASCVFQQKNPDSHFGDARVSADHDTKNDFGGDLPKDTVTLRFSDSIIIIPPGAGDKVPFLKPKRGDPRFDEQWENDAFRSKLMPLAENLRKRCSLMRLSI